MIIYSIREASQAKSPWNPIRFDKSIDVSSLWKMAENLIDFGGKGHRVIGLNKETKEIQLLEDKQRNPSMFSFSTIFRVITIAAVYITVVGAALHIGTIVYNRNKYVWSKRIPEQDFFKSSIRVFSKILDDKVENHALDLVNKGSFTLEEIAFMKNLKLKDMIIDDFTRNSTQEHSIKNTINFKIQNNKTKESMPFTQTRNQFSGSLQSDHLRRCLRHYKVEELDITLYDAINRIITSKDSSAYRLFQETATKTYTIGIDKLDEYADKCFDLIQIEREMTRPALNPENLDDINKFRNLFKESPYRGEYEPI